MSINGAPVMAASVVAVDVGKNMAALSVTDAGSAPVARPGRLRDDRAGPRRGAGAGVCCAAGCCGEGGGRGGRALSPAAAGVWVWPAGWEVLELSPARVTEQRRVQGRRRVKTDAIDLEAITELVLAGHGVPVTARSAAVTELTGWAMHRSRRVQTRTATKNQLLAQLDRCFPGLTLALPDVLGTQDRSFGGRGVRRPAPAGGAGGDSVCPVRREPWAAGAAVGGGPAGGGRPRRTAGPGGCGGPPGPGR